MRKQWCLTLFYISGIDAKKVDKIDIFTIKLKSRSALRCSKVLLTKVLLTIFIYNTVTWPYLKIYLIVAYIARTNKKYFVYLGITHHVAKFVSSLRYFALQRVTSDAISSSLREAWSGGETAPWCDSLQSFVASTLPYCRY